MQTLLGVLQRNAALEQTDPEGANARSVLVEPCLDGTPRKVNRRPVALVREEWRIVDRWWTEQPVHRRYFDVVLEGGENAGVYRDEQAGGWFSQRGV